MDLSRDPIVNAIHNGIKRGIRVTIRNECFGSALILIYSGIDTMAFLGMASARDDVTKADFVGWAERYIRFPCAEQPTGLDLYGARCALLHTYRVQSRLTRERKCRMIGYVNHMVPEVIYAPSVSSDVVMVSITALADAFFAGVDRFFVDLFSRPESAALAEKRFTQIIHSFPYPTPDSSPHGTVTSS